MNSQHKVKIVLLGDSITQQSFSHVEGGWGAALQDWYSRTGDVFNRGFSGYNSRWYLQCFDEVVRGIEGRASRMVVTLFLGANDASDDNEDNKLPTGQGVNVAEYEANMGALCDRVRTLYGGDAVLLLVTPAKVDSSRWATRRDERGEMYGAALKRLHASRASTDPHLHLVDTWSQTCPEGSDIDPELDLNDGLHLGPTGNRKLFSKIQHVIRDKYPHLAPDDDAKGQPIVKMHLPYWGDLAQTKGSEGSRALLDSWTW